MFCKESSFSIMATPTRGQHDLLPTSSLKKAGLAFTIIGPCTADKATCTVLVTASLSTGQYVNKSKATAIYD